MATLSHPDPVRTNFVALCEETLHVVGPVLGGLGYVCLALIHNTDVGRDLPVTSSIGALALIASGTSAYMLRQRNQVIATWLAVWGAYAAALFAIVSLRAPMATYLLIVPVVLANSLLRRRLVLLTAICALSVILFIAPEWMAVRADGDVLLPALVLIVVTITAWISSRNLQTTLSWMSHAYDNATRQEALVRDHSAELKRAFKALDEATVRLDRANVTLAHERNLADEARRIKQQFAQTISHELRTPLNLVMSFTDLMMQSPEVYGGPLPPTYLRDLTVVQRNAQHLHKLVNDVLELSQIEAAQMGMVLDKVDPTQLALEAVNMMRGLAEANHLELRTEIASDLPMLWVDATRIRQVLINLLNNAIKFTEQGSITTQVWQDPKQDRVIFAVQDTGPGIAPHDMPRLFQEFSQLDVGTRRKFPGTGLGLVISKHFVQLHNGQIWVESTLGLGSTFYFSLPICREDVTTFPCLSETSSERLPYSGKQVVLVITRSAFGANVLARYLRESTVIIVGDLEEARQKARHHLPQLIVFDIAQGALGVAQMQDFLTASNLTQSVAIACPLPGEELVRQQLGVELYLIKPVGRDDVLNALEQADAVARRVLVIDDDEDFVRLVRRFLESSGQGYRIASAHSGAEGLALAQQLRPDVILLDMQLPDVSGAHVAHQLRANEALADIPIIVVSGQEFAPTFDLAGASLVLSKAHGFSASELVKMIARVQKDS
jgi:signal transduction histidine kinase/CheY-like chemotaxis protein